jgi:hypothetical protein
MEYAPAGGGLITLAASQAVPIGIAVSGSHVVWSNGNPLVEGAGSIVELTSN